MVIRKQAIISWLLDKKNVIDEYSIGAPMTENKIHFGYLYNGMNHLKGTSKQSRLGFAGTINALI